MTDTANQAGEIIFDRSFEARTANSCGFRHWSAGWPHGVHQLGRLPAQGSIIDAPTAKRPQENISFFRKSSLEFAA
jgi:hypothetical protein